MANLRESLLDASQQPLPDVEQPLLEDATHTLIVDSKTTALVSVESATLDASTFWPCTLNLSKVILGASMMAVPKAFAILGVLLGSLLLFLCALLTAFTVDGLVEASERLKVTSYSAVVRHTCGRAFQYIVQLGIALTCFGNMVIYLVVMADVLVSSWPT